MVKLAADLSPVGPLLDVIALIRNKEVLGDEEYSDIERMLTALSLVIGLIFVPGVLKAVGKLLNKLWEVLKKIKAPSRVMEFIKKLLAKVTDKLKIGKKAAKGIPSQLNVSGKQFGQKMAQRARELGLDPSNPQVRAQFRSQIQRIFDNADEVRSGVFRGQGPNNTEGPVLFFRRGHDVVVTTPNGDFVTLLIGGINNSRFTNGVPLP